MWSLEDDFLTIEPLDEIMGVNSPWLSHNSHYIGPRCTGMKDINQCISLTRISIILGYYKEWIDQRFIIQQKQKDEEESKLNFNDDLIYDFINNVFDQENGYSNITLINDFHHLLDNHSHQFEDIHDRIIKQCNQDIITSYSSKRNYTLKTKTNFDKNNKDKNDLYFISTKEDKYIKEKCIQQILDVIYCYYVDSIQIGYFESNNVKKLIESMKIKDKDEDKNKDKTEDENIKFPKQRHAKKPSLIFKSFGRASFTKKPIYKKQKEVNEMMNLYDYIKRERNKKKEEYGKQLYDGIYRTENNRFSSITRFNQYIMDEKKEDEEEKETSFHPLELPRKSGERENKENGENKKDEDNEFGYRYYYNSMWRTNKNQDPYNIGYEYNEWWLRPKHNGLKDELLDESLSCSINIEEWNEISEKAQNYTKTDICKKLRAANGYKDSCDIDSNSIITINHIISIILYTNYFEIEYELNSTYRRNIFNNNTESNKSLKDRHRKLGNLGKYLSESVQVYGSKSGLSKKIEYYHIINKSIHIPASICYNGPLSVTSSKMVAINALYSYESYESHQSYNDKDGLLLEIGGRDTKHFDCKWFSDYTNESEMIFMHCQTPLIVQNVIDIGLGVNYHLYLYTYSVLNLLLIGGDIDKQKGMNFEVDLKIINPIYSFLYYKFYGKKNKFCNESLPVYIEKLFNSYFDKIIKLNINWHQLNKAKRKVTGFGKMQTFNIKIVSLILPFLMYYQSEWIKVNLLIKAFPNLKTLTISGLKLNHSQFEDILFQLKNEANINHHPIQKLVIKDSQHNQLSFNFIQEKYNSRFKKLKWELTNPQWQVFEISKC